MLSQGISSKLHSTSTFRSITDIAGAMMNVYLWPKADIGR